MNLFKGKVRTICMCNVMVPFVCTGFLGMKTTGIITGSTTDEAHEISLTASDTEPVSQFWEGENKFAFINESIEAVIDQQEFTGPQKIQGDENTFAFVTCGVQAIMNQQANASNEKKVENKTTKKMTTKKTTKKNTSKTTSVVEKKEVATSKTYTKPSTSSLTGDAIVSFAKQFMGLRYKSGTPSLTNGADCSGFTMLIYKEFGVSLPRTVGGQMGRGTAVSKSNLQKGDLVFYKAKGAKGGASHVGIYIGGGQVIHESRPGVGVKISTVNMMQYVGARRVINSTAAKIAEQKLAEQNKEEIKTDNAVNTIDNSNVTNDSASTNIEEKNENINNNVVDTNEVAITQTPSTETLPLENQEVVNTDTPKEENKVEETPQTEVVVENTPVVEVKEEPKKEEVVETPVSNIESN